MIKSVQSVRPNAQLIRAVAPLWIKDDDIVLDITYGRGMWWKLYRPLLLIAHDLHTLDGVDFRHLPELDASVDVVAFDPPYTSKGGRKTSTITDMDDAYGLSDAPSSPWRLDVLIALGIEESARVLRPGGRLLVKTMDYISSGRFHQGHYQTIESAQDAGLTQVDEFVHVSGTGPQPLKNPNGSVRRQVHSRRSHSFLCVFQAPSKRSKH